MWSCPLMLTTRLSSGLANRFSSVWIGGQHPYGAELFIYRLKGSRCLLPSVLFIYCNVMSTVAGHRQFDSWLLHTSKTHPETAPHTAFPRQQSTDIFFVSEQGPQEPHTTDICSPLLSPTVLSFRFLASPLRPPRSVLLPHSLPPSLGPRMPVLHWHSSDTGWADMEARLTREARADTSRPS